MNLEGGKISKRLDSTYEKILKEYEKIIDKSIIDIKSIIKKFSNRNSPKFLIKDNIVIEPEKRFGLIKIETFGRKRIEIYIYDTNKIAIQCNGYLVNYIKDHRFPESKKIVKLDDPPNVWIIPSYKLFKKFISGVLEAIIVKHQLSNQ